MSFLPDCSWQWEETHCNKEESGREDTDLYWDHEGGRNKCLVYESHWLD